jgi:hypothetical protein
VDRGSAVLTLEGVIDLHVHAAPELFARVGDAITMAEAARDAGMAGLLLKAHHESTVTRAYYASKVVDGIDLYGGLVLNEFVGGFNPQAVGAALQQGARMIWGPTMHAAHHVDHFGKGTYGVGHMTLAPELASPGISCLAADGSLRAEMRSIIEQAAKADVTIATGHLGPADVRALVAECAAQGVRCLLTHVYFLDKSEDFLLEMAAQGAFLEVSASVSFPLEHYLLRNDGGGMMLEDVASLVEKVGATKVVISSDCGQIHNSSPTEALRSFLNAAKAVGIPEDDIVTMTRQTPRVLLGLEPA